MFPMSGVGFMGRGGGAPVIGPMFTADGVAFAPTTSAFFDFNDFDEITGSGDYTFMGWYKFDTTSGTNRLTLYSQNSSLLGGANRISITNVSTEVNTTAYGANITVRNADEPQCIVVRKQSGTTSVFHLINGIFSPITGLSVPDVGAPTQKTVGATFTIGTSNTNTSGQIMAVQITNTALSDLDIQDLMENYDLLPSTTASLPFYTNLSGSSDNGAYPAVMTGASAPSPYVASASFSAENPWQLFDGNFVTRCIIKNAAETGSAGAWLKLDLGSGNAQAIDAYYFRSWPGQGLNSFTVSGSNDDSTYIDLFTGNGANNNTQLQKFTWINSTSYRYYRITCNSGFNAPQWTHYQSILVDQSKAWTSGGGYAKDGTMTFPT